MVRLNRLLALAAAGLSVVTEAAVIAGRKVNIDPSSNGLQDIVTWDKHTIFVHGKRVLFYSGEFHPFRFANLVKSRHLNPNIHQIACCGSLP